jgi:diacylglycerol kinase (ATP)
LKNTIFIVNPASARGATRRAWAEMRAELINLFPEFIERITSRPGEATEVTREALANGITRVIAVGGDGTLSEVVNGYVDDTGHHINEGAAIGILPSGTGSDFCRSLGLNSAKEAIDALAGASTKMLDAVRIVYSDKDGASASRAFINVASFGLGGDVSALVNRWRDSLPRWIGGRARFVAAAVRALERYRNYDVQVRLDDGRDIEIASNLMVVANGKFGGAGMKLAPHAEMDDGLLDVIITDRATRLDVMKELPRIRRGGYLSNPKVTEFRARRVSITASEPMAIDVDGEMAGYTPARLTILPRAVRFLMGVG